MNRQDAAVSLMQPAQHNDLVANCHAVQTGLNVGIQDQVRVRCAFVALSRSICGRGERASHAPYRADREVDSGVVDHGMHSITDFAEQSRLLGRGGDRLAEIEPALYRSGRS
jgi:hypothetical protein